MMAGILARVSTLLMTVGICHSPRWTGKGGLARGWPRCPSMDAMRAVSSPQTKAPAPSLILMSKSKGDPKMLAAEEPAPPRLVDRELEALNRQRVFRPDVDIALMRADGVGADDHALDDRVRIAFDHGPVHERAGIALISIADDVFFVPARLPAEFPLEARGEPRSAPAAQA